MMYVRNGKLYSKRIKNKWYILEPGKEAMRELNEVGSLIWNLLKKPTGLNSLVQEICKDYSVEKDIAEKDVKKFISEYVKEGYIDVLN